VCWDGSDAKRVVNILWNLLYKLKDGILVAGKKFGVHARLKRSKGCNSHLIWRAHYVPMVTTQFG